MTGATAPAAAAPAARPAARGASWLACHLPEGRCVRAGRVRRRRSGTGSTPDGRRRPGATCARVATCLAANDAARAPVRAAAHDPRALERLVRLGLPARRPVLPRGRADAGPPAGDLAERLTDRDARRRRRGVRARADRSIFVGLHFGAIELPALFLARRVGGAVAPMETLDDPDLQAWFVRTRGAVGIRIVGLREARRELTGRAARRDGRSGSSAIAT